MNSEALRTQLRAQWQVFRGNRRLQAGLLAILAILAVESGMRWLEHLERREKRLMELRDQKLRLQGQTRDKSVLELRLTAVEHARTVAKARMWVVPSEAVGQARQKDWLLDVFRQIGVTAQSIVLAAPRVYGETPATSASAISDGEVRNETRGIREFRATLVFPFSPDALEKALAALEGGEPFTRVESLFANRRTRRVELGLSMLMEILPGHVPEPAPPAPEKGTVTTSPIVPSPLTPAAQAERNPA